MKFESFTRPSFIETLSKLFNANLPVKVAYRLGKIQKLLIEENERYEELRISIVKRFAQTDSAGELVADASGNVKILESSAEEFAKEMQELLSIEIQTEKISIADLDGVELTSTELLLIDGILED